MSVGLLRFAILLAVGFLAIFWIYVAGASVADALPLAKGVRLGLYGMLVLMALVSPALAFAASNTLLNLAAVLAGTAVAISVFTFAVYMPKPSITVLLLSAALLVTLFGTYFLFGRTSASPERPFERRGCAC